MGKNTQRRAVLIAGQGCSFRYITWWTWMQNIFQNELDLLRAESYKYILMSFCLFAGVRPKETEEADFLWIRRHPNLSFPRYCSEDHPTNSQASPELKTHSVNSKTSYEFADIHWIRTHPMNGKRSYKITDRAWIHRHATNAQTSDAFTDVIWIHGHPLNSQAPADIMWIRRHPLNSKTHPLNS